MEKKISRSDLINFAELTHRPNALRTKAINFFRKKILLRSNTGLSVDVQHHFLPNSLREIGIRKKFHMRAAALVKAVQLTDPKSKALRCYLGLHDDKDCLHVFEFGKSPFACFSDNAKNKMTQALPKDSK